jgi:hypothetical protein
MIGVVGTIILASAFTVHTLGTDSARTLAAPLDSIDFKAQDPAGEFTITVRHGQPLRRRSIAYRCVAIVSSIPAIAFGLSDEAAALFLPLRITVSLHESNGSLGRAVCRGRAVDCTL